MGKILIVDDHPIVRLAGRLLLERDGHEVVGEADNGVDAVSMARDLQPDVMLLDLDIPKLGGLEVIARVQTLPAPPRVLVLSSQDPAFFSGRCMRAGAHGYVYKQENTAELLAGIKAVLSGYGFFPNQALKSIRNNSQDRDESQLLESLSDRELTVLRYLALGYTNKQIADEFLINNKTVSSYKKRLQDKLGENSVVGLSGFAKRNLVV
ncbi:response regulator [Pseudomonas sp. S2_D10]